MTLQFHDILHSAFLKCIVRFQAACYAVISPFIAVALPMEYNVQYICMKDGQCIVRVSLDMLNVIIRRPRIVTVIYGYFIRSEVFLSFLFPSSPLFSLFTRCIFSWRLVLEASRVENPLSSGSFILKIGGQWRVNLQENTRTVRDSRRSQATLGYSR